MNTVLDGRALWARCRNLRTLAQLGVSALSLAMSSQAGAQTSDQKQPETGSAVIAPAPTQPVDGAVSPAPDDGSVQGPDIVVTAEKHSTTVMKTGIAVTALTGEELATRGIRDASDLQRFSPALSVTNNGLTNNVNIRGIGLNVTTPAVVSGVAIYRDNLFQAPLVAAEPYYDIGNIQVLRGPQGTFVGTNSTGGAVFISSADPAIEDGTHGYASAKLGNYGDRGLEGAVNQPLGDTLAVRAAFTMENRDSFSKNLTPNPSSNFKVLPEPGNLNMAAGRVGLLWRPTPDLQILTKAEYYQNKTGGFAMKPIPGTRLAPYAPSDPFEIAYSTPDTRYDESLWRVDSEIKYTLPSGITLRSVSGITTYDYRLVSDVGASTQLSAVLNNRAHEYVTSEEVNILSPDSGRLRWVVGGYYNHDRAKVQVGQRSYAGLGAATTPTNNISIDYINVKETYAGFAGLRYKLTDQLELQAGARYTWNRVDNDPANMLRVYLTSGPGTPANPVLVASQPQTGSERDQGATWKAALNWTPDAHNFLYAFVATGKKAGGIQDAVTNFLPEKVTDYEVGWKSTMLDGHLRTQVGAFYNDYSNLQVVAIVPSSGRNSVYNSGAARIFGFEGEAELRWGGLQLNLSGSYVDSKVQIANIVNASALPDGGAGTLGIQCPTGQTTACFDYRPYIVSLSGSLPYAPRYNVTAGAAYSFELGDRIKLTPRVDVARTGEQFTSIFQNGISRLRDRTIVNAKLSLDLKNFVIEAYATNLTNLTYPTGRTGNAWFYGAPRQFGARLSFRF